jgi:hypothetical protein
MKGSAGKGQALNEGELCHNWRKDKHGEKKETASTGTLGPSRIAEKKAEDDLRTSGYLKRVRSHSLWVTAYLKKSCWIR